MALSIASDTHFAAASTSGSGVASLAAFAWAGMLHAEDLTPAACLA